MNRPYCPSVCPACDGARYTGPRGVVASDGVYLRDVGQYACRVCCGSGTVWERLPPSSAHKWQVWWGEAVSPLDNSRATARPPYDTWSEQDMDGLVADDLRQDYGENKP